MIFNLENPPPRRHAPRMSARPAIPDHELLRPIGRGSYGEVWLARNIMGAWRAVKIVSRDSFGSARPYEREFAGIEKFEPVSRAHDSQLDVLHVGRDDAAGCFYYVMELADDVARGQDIAPESYAPRTLRAELEARGRLPARECIDLGIALATALEHLHSHGLIHRDVKPSNVIFVHGRPKLADIGLVAAMDESVSFVGTEGYVPPEGPGSERGDLFALGKVLYEIHTGLDCAAFPDQPTALLPRDEPVLARELNLIILKACAPDAERRQPSLTALREEMELLKTGRSVERLWRAEEERAAAVEREAVMRRRLRWGAALSAIAAAAVVLAAWAWQQQRNAARERERAARAREHLSAMLDLNTGPLREKLERLGKLSLLRDVNETVARSFDANEKEPLFLALEAGFLKNHSRVLAALGRSTDAIAAARHASTLLARLAARERDEPRWPRELAETESLLAEYFSAHGEHSRARDAAESGLARLAKADAPPLLRAQLRRRLGEAQAALRDRPAAVVTLAGAVAEMEALTQTMPAAAPQRAELRHELALAHESLGQVRLDSPERGLALDSFRASAALLDELAPPPACTLDRVRVETGLADALAAGGAAGEALAAYRRSREMAARLAAGDPDNVLWKREHALSGAVLAKHLRLHAPEKADEALALLRESERELRELTALDPGIEAWHWDRTGTELEFGEWYRDRQQPADALPHYRSALAVMERFAADPNTPADRPYGLGTVLVHALPERRAEKRALLESWRVRAHAAARVNPAWHFVAAVCEHLLGESDREDTRLDAALAAHRRGFGEMEALFREARREQYPSPGFGWRERRADFCAQLAGDLRDAGRAGEARAFAAEARRAIFESGGYPAPEHEISEESELREIAGE